MNFLISLAASAVAKQFILFLLKQAAMSSSNKLDDAIVEVVEAAYNNDAAGIRRGMTKFANRK